MNLNSNLQAVKKMFYALKGCVKYNRTPSMKTPLLSLLFISFCASAIGQSPIETYHDNIKKTHEARMKALHAQNAANAEQRYNKAAYKRYKAAMKMRQDSKTVSYTHLTLPTKA